MVVQPSPSRMKWEKDSWVRVLLQESFIYYRGKKEINEVVTLLRILQEFVFTPPSMQWDEIISLKISSIVSPDKDPHHISKIG